MLSNKTISKIQKLLAQGTLSKREIARRTDVNEMTVYDIIKGKLPKKVLNVRRCSRCGCTVVWPCLACSFDAVSVAKELPDHLVVGLDLMPEHHERYLQVRKKGGKHGIS